MTGRLPAILLGTGLFIVVSSIVVGWIGFPKLIEYKISQQIRLVNGSDTFKKWENIPIPIYMKVHIFNVTNPKEIVKGGKPVLQEVGPYVYQQKRVKTDVVIDEDNDTITYRQPITYFFRPDMSNGTENDILSVVNLPFVGVAAKAMKMGNVPRYMVKNLFEEIYPEEPPFITRTVDQMLFGGYYVPFMKDLAELSGEQLLKNNTFGLYYGKNGTSDSGEFEVYSGVQDGSKFGTFRSWNGRTELEWWNDKYCNMINGSDGALFPPFVTEDRVLKIFSPELCRSLQLTFENHIEILGLPGYRFTLPKELLADPRVNPDNMCYCTEPGKDMENCPKGGAFQLSACRKGTPLVVSLPHFLDGSPEYLNQSDGLNPIREKHETSIILEKNTGVLLRASKRIQMNIELGPNKLFPALKKMPKIYLPLFWIDESAALTVESAERIKGKLFKPQEIVGIACWAVCGVGCLIILISLIIYFVRGRRDGGMQLQEVFLDDSKLHYPVQKNNENEWLQKQCAEL